MADFQDISLNSALWEDLGSKIAYSGGPDYVWHVDSEASQNSDAWLRFYSYGFSTGDRPDWVCVRVSFNNAAGWASKISGSGSLTLSFATDFDGDTVGANGQAQVALSPGFDFTQTVLVAIPVRWGPTMDPFGSHPTPEGMKAGDWKNFYVRVDASLGVTGETLNVFRMAAGTCEAEPPPIEYDCGEKPYTHSLVLGAPGFPGTPAVPYRPETCFFPPCYTRTITITNALVGGGSSSSGSSGTIWIADTRYGCAACTVTDPTGGGTVPPPQFVVGGFLTDDDSAPRPQTRTERICPPKECLPEQPYVPAIPAQEPTPDRIVSDYNLGWNFDVEGCDFNGLQVTINTDMVSNSTAGVAVGVCAKADAAQPGIVKYRVMWLFTGGQVEGFVDGLSVSAEEARDGHTYGIRHAGESLALLRDDVVVSELAPYGDLSYLAATIYKGGDAACFSCDALTEATTYVYTSEPSNLDFPMPRVRAGASMDGAQFFMPAPALTASGELGAAGAAAALRLPMFRLFANGDGLAGAAGRLPAMSLDGAGGIPIPTAEGADLFLSGLRMYAESGFRLTGGAQMRLPAMRFFAADRSMGFAQGRYPAPSLYGAEFWRFTGVLFGEMGGLVVDDMWGWVSVPNNLSGSLSPLSGEFFGGAQLRGDMLLAGEFSATVPNIGRINGSFANLVMNSTGLIGAYGEIAGILATRVEGELWGGATLSGSLAALVGDLDGTTGVVGALLGELSPLVGEAFGSLQNYGILVGEFGPMEPLWGLLDGELIALAGEFVEGVTLGEYRAWVMNLAHAGLTHYPGYGFDFIVRWQGKHYLGNLEGIFELGGDSDDGLPIAAGFTLPSSDYGTSTMKRAPRVYYQGRVQKRMTALVRADDGEQFETESEAYGGEDYWRVRVGRGLRGHHLEFGLDNQSGGDFEIEAVDVLIADSGRKI